MGDAIAINGSDLPAYVNGQRCVFNHDPERERYSDPDASWGHRSAIATRKGGGYYEYKLHTVVDVATELPIAWTVRSANAPKTLGVPGLLDATRACGLEAGTAILDKGYDATAIYDAGMARGARPIVPLRRTQGVVLGWADPPSCERGTWTFAGADTKRGATNWRCPEGACSPGSTWNKADRLHALVPRSTRRWRETFRRRGCIERSFGRLKHDWALLPLRVRGPTGSASTCT